MFSDLTTKKDFHSHFLDILRKISTEVLGIRVINCTSLNLANLAAGRIDVYLKNKVDFIDLVAGACIINEAGGKLTDFHNKNISQNTEHVVITNKLLHRKVMRLIQ